MSPAYVTSISHNRRSIKIDLLLPTRNKRGEFVHLLKNAVVLKDKKGSVIAHFIHEIAEDVAKVRDK
jgi:hypothetical protein